MPTPPDDDFFAFLRYSRSQQFGLVVVALLIVVVGGLQIWSPFSPPAVEIEEDWATYAADFRRATAPAEPEAFFFDPNTVSKAELIRLGLKPWVADSWLKYRGSRTNAFRRAEDIRKLYRLDSADANRLLPLVRLATSAEQNSMANEVARPNDGPTQPNRPASFRFDPNTVSRAELIKLGLSEKQADAFLKYRAKVSFTSADELAKIRILTPKNLAHLQPLVDIAPAGDGLVASNEVSAVVPTTYGGRVVTPQPYQPKVEPPLASLDINLATAEDWQSLPGIGPARSRKIINFREKLGGFSSIQQVGTTYGIPDSTFQTIQPFLQLGEVSINQLKINSLGAEDLKKHPYISRKLAEILVNYRNNHGPFRSESDLADIRILSESDRKRLLPYLDFSN